MFHATFGSFSAMPLSPVQLHLDLPVATPSFSEFEVTGWVISQTPISRVSLERPGESISVAFVDRPDVRAAFPDYANASGFVGFATIHFVRDSRITFKVEAGGAVYEVVKPLSPPPFPHVVAAPVDFPIHADIKAEKIRRILPYLACPACRAPLKAESAACVHCGAQYSLSASLLDFLSPEQKLKIPSVDDTPASHGGVDEVMFALIHRFVNGLILDCGAGSKSRTYPNVINLEIMPYPSTDVLAVNEALPFADGTFDVVFSLATLEHVRDPFRSAQEIMRVLKPGGFLYSMVPLLAPFHGFPAHYYNMTIEGHKNLYGADLHVIDARVPLSGRPIFALTWILNSWIHGLPPACRDEFMNLRVRDLIGNPQEYLEKPFVRFLAAETNMEIAAITCIIGEKR